MTDYMTKTIIYTHGHACRPNGVGDYEWLCQGEVTPGFIPFMARGVIKACTRCGIKVEAEVDDD